MFRNARILFASIFLLSCVSVGSAQEEDKEMLDRKRALQELESVLDRSDRIMDLKQKIWVRGKAAAILWPLDQDRARSIFLSLWEFIDKKTDDGSLQEEDARIDLLHFVVRVDRELANSFERNLSRRQNKLVDSGRDSVLDRLTGVDLDSRRRAFLAWRVVEDDPILAASILDLGRSENIPPMVPNILTKIREKDPVLANTIVLEALANFESQTPTAALAGLGTLMTYVFQTMPNGPVTIEVLGSDDNVRNKFTSVSLDVLKRSVSQSDESLSKDEGLSPRSFDFRRLGQALVSSTLTVLAPIYLREAFPEVTTLNLTIRQRADQQMLALVDGQVAAVRAMMGRIAASKSIEADIIDKIVRNDFPAALLAAEKIATVTHRQVWEDLVLVASTKHEIRTKDHAKALSNLKKLNNKEQALELFLQVSRAASEAKSDEISTVALQEAVRIANESKAGGRARSLLAIAADSASISPTQSASLLRSAVSELNELLAPDRDSRAGSATRRTGYWDDPDNYLSSNAFHRAFSANGAEDLNETLNIGLTLRSEPLKMVATLAAIEKMVRAQSEAPQSVTQSSDSMTH